MSQTQHVTTDSFGSEVINQALPALIDFYATWCPPCKMLSPVLDQLAAEYDGQVKIVKVNVDDEPVLASQYQISSVPTLIFFQDGQPVDQLVGVPPVTALRQKLDQLSAVTNAKLAVG